VQGTPANAAPEKHNHDIGWFGSTSRLLSHELVHTALVGAYK
jgi:hypothetical protein